MILRICVVIPTYNNSTTIEAVAIEVLEQTPYPLFIVDDGSDTPVEQLLKHSSTLRALSCERLRILRFERNCGKGVALQAVFKKALELNFTHVLAFDGDGQHLVSEISKLITVGKVNPWSLVIGSRRLTASTVPGSSKFGRAFSNYWVQFQTGQPLSDSQSGLRLYPLFQLQNLRFWCRRYDFEIEILIRLIWRGVGIMEVETDVFYPEKNLRVSHFNKLWDNVRISALNTLLVILSLLKSHRSPMQMGIAVGTGVLIGTTPFFGLHTLIVAAISFLFRLNAVVLWLGSQISIPPVAPFLVAGSILVGHSLIPGDATHWPSYIEFARWSPGQIIAFAGEHFRAWLLGSLAVGSALGVIIGSMAAWISFRVKSKAPTKATWNGRSRGGKFGNGFLKIVLRNVGIKAGYFCLLFIVPYFYIFAPKGRRALNEYWSAQSPHAHFFRRQILILRHFYRFGQVLMDSVFQNFKTRESFQTRPHGIENILKASNHKKGLFMLSAHTGAWSLAASLLNTDGFKNKIFIVEYQAGRDSFEKVRGPEKEAHVKKLSMTHGSPSVFEIYEALGKGQTIGLMADRPLAARYELVLFMGKLAPFDTTPFRLAASTGTPLLFSFGFKAEGTHYDFFASPARVYKYHTAIDSRLRCQQWAQEFATHLEAHLRKYPDQWFNFYSFWSSLPISPTGEKNSTGQNCLLEELDNTTAVTPEMAPVL